MNKINVNQLQNFGLNYDGHEDDSLQGHLANMLDDINTLQASLDNKAEQSQVDEIQAKIDTWESSEGPIEDIESIKHRLDHVWESSEYEGKPFEEVFQDLSNKDYYLETELNKLKSDVEPVTSEQAAYGGTIVDIVKLVSGSSIGQWGYGRLYGGINFTFEEGTKYKINCYDDSNNKITIYSKVINTSAKYGYSWAVGPSSGFNRCILDNLDNGDSIETNTIGIILSDDNTKMAFVWSMDLAGSDYENYNRFEIVAEPGVSDKLDEIEYRLNHVWEPITGWGGEAPFENAIDGAYKYAYANEQRINDLRSGVEDTNNRLLTIENNYVPKDELYNTHSEQSLIWSDSGELDADAVYSTGANYSYVNSLPEGASQDFIAHIIISAQYEDEYGGYGIPELSIDGDYVFNLDQATGLYVFSLTIQDTVDYRIEYDPTNLTATLRGTIINQDLTMPNICDSQISYYTPIISDTFRTMVNEVVDVPEIDLSDYYTKSELDDTVSDLQYQITTNSEDLDDLSDIKADKIALNEYYTKSEVDDRLTTLENNKANKSELENYYTKSEIDNKVGAKIGDSHNDGPFEIDYSGDDFKDEEGYIPTSAAVAEFVENSIEPINNYFNYDVIGYKTSSDISDDPDKNWVENAFSRVYASDLICNLGLVTIKFDGVEVFNNVPINFETKSDSAWDSENGY